MKVLGIVFILIGAAIAAWDVAISVADGLRLRALGEIWFSLEPNSLQLLQPAIERHLSPALWDPWILTVLESPAALAFGLAGGAILAASAIFAR